MNTTKPRTFTAAEQDRAAESWTFDEERRGHNVISEVTRATFHYHSSTDGPQPLGVHYLRSDMGHHLVRTLLEEGYDGGFERWG